MKNLIRNAALGIGLICVSLPVAAQQLYGGPDEHYRGGSEAIAYKHPDFRGPALAIYGAVPNLALERFNDTISSIELSGTWEICVDPNYRGKCKIVDGPVYRLADIRMNDNITSLRPINGRVNGYRNQHRDDHYGSDRGHNDRYQNGAIVLFKDPSFRGQAISLDRGISNLKDLRFNDTVSSIAINSGTWLACEHPDYRGRCEIIDGSIEHMRYVGLNDKITSIKRYRGRSSYRY